MFFCHNEINEVIATMLCRVCSISEANESLTSKLLSEKEIESSQDAYLIKCVRLNPAMPHELQSILQPDSEKLRADLSYDKAKTWAESFRNTRRKNWILYRYTQNYKNGNWDKIFSIQNLEVLSNNLKWFVPRLCQSKDENAIDIINTMFENLGKHLLTREVVEDNLLDMYKLIVDLHYKCLDILKQQLLLTKIPIEEFCDKIIDFSGILKKLELKLSGYKRHIAFITKCNEIWANHPNKDKYLKPILNAANKYYEYTALLRAARDGYTEIAQLINSKRI